MLSLTIIIQTFLYSKLINELKDEIKTTSVKNTDVKYIKEATQHKEKNILKSKTNSKKTNSKVQAIKNNKKKEDTKVIGVLNIPDINLKNKLVYEGTNLNVLSIGIGHFTNTSICNGNVGLASHNNGERGDEFKNLKNIKLGSKIYYKTQYGTKVYLVKIITEISDEDWSYLKETKENKITLLTCISGKPNNRLCVQGIEVT